MLLFVLAAVDAVELCAEEVLVDDAVRCFAAMDDPREEYLPFPVVPPPRASRNACAPKETRRAKGETGVLLGGVFSFSSITASSKLVELDPIELDKLPRRMPGLPNGEVCEGEPERPRVVMDTRRRWFAAAVAIGLGNEGGAVGLPTFAPELLDLEKSSAKEAPGVKEARRWWVERGG